MKKKQNKGKKVKFPKMLFLLLFLLFILSALVTVFTWKETKGEAKTKAQIEGIMEKVDYLRDLNDDKSGKNPAQIKTTAGFIDTAIESIDENFATIKNAPPLHLSKENARLAPTGLFKGDFLRELRLLKEKWTTVSETISGSKLRADLPAINGAESVLTKFRGEVEKLKETSGTGKAVLMRIMQIMLLVLAFLLLLLLLTILQYLFKSRKAKLDNKRVSSLKEKANRAQKPRQSVNEEDKVLSLKSTHPASGKTPRNSEARLTPEDAPSASSNVRGADKDTEISRLRVLLETLFNDQYRPLCIADSDGDILMDNKAFQEISGGFDEEETLPEVLVKVLPKQQYQSFFSTFQDFFQLDATAAEKVQPLDGIRVKGSDPLYRLSLQPFHTQDGERCSLVSLQEMSNGAPTVKNTTTPSLSNLKQESENASARENPVKQEKDTKLEDTAINPDIPAAEHAALETTKSSIEAAKNIIPAAVGGLANLDQDVIKPKRTGAPKGAPFKEEVRVPVRLTNKAEEAEEDPFEDSSSFSILPVIKDLTNKLASVNEKKINLDTRNFDESVIPETLKPVILETLGQAVKFSIPHSVETSETRLKNGKEDTAQIILSNKYEENIKGLDKAGVVFYYKDDGIGLDPAVILDVAKKAKLTNKRSPDELTKNEILSFLFNPQFNLPKKHALDVVNLVRLKETVVKNLKGKMRLSYQEGESFSFQLLVPTEK